jgi:hypothetical protein
MPTPVPRPAARAFLADHSDVRHLCYQLHIGCTHLGWHAWTGDRDELHAVARRLEPLLDEG